MSTKHMEPVTTIRNQYMFLQEVENKDTNSPSRKQKKYTHQKFEKKSFLVDFHIWHKFSSFKTTNCLLLGSNWSYYVYWQTYRGF